MAQVLLLGTWLTSLDAAREAIARRSGDQVSFGGLPGQLEARGPRIEVERAVIVNDRTWKHGMPRSVVQGEIARHDDDLFVVVDEPAGGDGIG
ncbi:MAG: hypothetical protein C4290_09755 [Chloroflexota bacterium]